MLAASGCRAADERRENTLRRKKAGGEIADRHAEANGGTIDFARHAHQSAFGLRDGVVAGTRFEGTGLSVAGHRGIDQPWMTLSQRSVVEAESLQRARLEVFDEDVGAFDQCVEYAPPLRLLEVEREAFLVAIDAEEVGA